MQEFNPIAVYFPGTSKRSLLFLLVLTSFIITAIGCGSSSSEPEARICLAGEPRSIFKADDNGVFEHKFLPNGQFSQEHIRFKTGELLSIMQKGCDTLIQTFELPVPDSVQTWPSFRRLALERFMRYGNLDPRHFAFGQYARALEVLPPNFPIAQPANLAPGLTVRFFKLPTAEGTTWQVVYEQDLTQVN
ncbi:MAG: hypothetical protein AB8F78_01045 [Saprospiraceae bacterium]